MSQLTKTLGAFVSYTVQSHTDAEGVVDIRKVARALGFDMYISQHLRTADKGKLYAAGSEVERETVTSPTILLNEKNTDEENRTVVALLIAEYMLSQRNQNGREITCDMFFLQGIRQYRVSRQLFLATRLLIPEHIIEQTQSITFSAPAYAAKAKILPGFLACAYPKRDVSGLLGFIDSMQMSFTIGKKIGNSQTKVDDYLPVQAYQAHAKQQQLEAPGLTEIEHDPQAQFNLKAAGVQ